MRYRRRFRSFSRGRRRFGRRRFSGRRVLRRRIGFRM